MNLDDRVWALLPAGVPGRQHTAILADLNQSHPEVTSADLARVLSRLLNQGRVLSHVRHGQERWTRTAPLPVFMEPSPALWEDL